LASSSDLRLPDNMLRKREVVRKDNTPVLLLGKRTLVQMSAVHPHTHTHKQNYLVYADRYLYLFGSVCYQTNVIHLDDDRFVILELKKTNKNTLYISGSRRMVFAHFLRPQELSHHRTIPTTDQKIPTGNHNNSQRRFWCLRFQKVSFSRLP